ncbi:MLO-like protein 12 [Linum grandiflorum]
MMLLGFVSLLLAVCQKTIANICIPRSIGETFLPCGFPPYHASSHVEEEAKCAEQGKVSLLSRHGVMQLNYMMFVLASFHAMSCTLIFSLGMAKAHFEQEIGYNFQKFIKRAMERDFRVVVGTSIWISTFSVLSIFFQAHKFHSFLWLPFVPLVMLLVIGAKLQDIITSMCLESSNGKSLQVVNGTLLVRPSDGFFWFGSPKFVLRLIHFIIFQNSFQLAFFTWTSKKFGLRSCFHRETENITIRVFVGILVHFLAGYVTLPLYALVTQMGTSMRKSVFPSAVVIGLRRWRRRARKNLKNKRKCNSTVAVETGDLDASSSFDSLGSDDERESELESESELEVVVVEVRSEEEERRRED